jgi:hypothetical protein
MPLPSVAEEHPGIEQEVGLREEGRAAAAAPVSESVFGATETGAYAHAGGNVIAHLKSSIHVKDQL